MVSKKLVFFFAFSIFTQVSFAQEPVYKCLNELQSFADKFQLVNTDLISNKVKEITLHDEISAGRLTIGGSNKNFVEYRVRFVLDKKGENNRDMIVYTTVSFVNECELNDATNPFTTHAKEQTQWELDYDSN